MPRSCNAATHRTTICSVVGPRDQVVGGSMFWCCGVLFCSPEPTTPLPDVLDVSPALRPPAEEAFVWPLIEVRSDTRPALTAGDSNGFVGGSPEAPLPCKNKLFRGPRTIPKPRYGTDG